MLEGVRNGIYHHPRLLFLGVVGNSLNIYVLWSKQMRNRANDLLAAVSFSDLMFFIFMLPHSLAAYFGMNLWYRRNYLLKRLFLSALANWMSASAIW